MIYEIVPQKRIFKFFKKKLQNNEGKMSGNQRNLGFFKNKNDQSPRVISSISLLEYSRFSA